MIKTHLEIKSSWCQKWRLKYFLFFNLTQGKKHAVLCHPLICTVFFLKNRGENQTLLYVYIICVQKGMAYTNGDLIWSVVNIETLVIAWHDGAGTCASPFSKLFVKSYLRRLIIFRTCMHQHDLDTMVCCWKVAFIGQIQNTQTSTFHQKLPIEICNHTYL